jgi:hypothetical protein
MNGQNCHCAQFQHQDFQLHDPISLPQDPTEGRVHG